MVESHQQASPGFIRGSFPSCLANLVFEEGSEYKSGFVSLKEHLEIKRKCQELQKQLNSSKTVRKPEKIPQTTQFFLDLECDLLKGKLRAETNEELENQSQKNG